MQPLARRSEIPPGHDAWVVGDDSCRLLDWGGKVRESAEG
jgi:hypothetical protein